MKSWLFLSPDQTTIRRRRLTYDFYAKFHLIFHNLQFGKEIPYQVPVDIRSQIDVRYRTAWKMTHSVPGLTESQLARWIATLDGEKQGVSLIALLEIQMHKKGLADEGKLLGAVVQEIEQVQTLRHASEDQISNFFATFVRAVSANLEAAGARLDKKLLEASLNYFARFWSLCTDQYSNRIAGNVVALFKATIEKLETYDVPLCMWIFLAGSGMSNYASDMEDPAFREIDLTMEVEITRRLPHETPWVYPTLITVEFALRVCRIHSGFFPLVDDFMHAVGKAQHWKTGWQAHKSLEYFKTLKQDKKMTYDSLRAVSKFLEAEG